jgi:hypothetical protein
VVIPVLLTTGALLAAGGDGGGARSSFPHAAIPNTSPVIKTSLFNLNPCVLAFIVHSYITI